jgi:hypothetical protein
MDERGSILSQLHARCGYQPLNRGWAKAEILLGLGAACLGLFLGDWALSRPVAELEWGVAAAGWVLCVLGGYLAAAGHRSHLYQSNNELTANLVEEIRRLQAKG